jgi:hypothetical protein
MNAQYMKLQATSFSNRCCKVNTGKAKNKQTNKTDSRAIKSKLVHMRMRNEIMCAVVCSSCEVIQLREMRVECNNTEIMFRQIISNYLSIDLFTHIDVGQQQIVRFCRIDEEKDLLNCHFFHVIVMFYNHC